MTDASGKGAPRRTLSLPPRSPKPAVDKPALRRSGPPSETRRPSPESRRPSAPRALPDLAEDSMGRALLLAAERIAAVLAGQSLQHLPPPPAEQQAAVHDLTLGVLRRYQIGPALLQPLLNAPLTDNRLQALLLAAIYRLDTRPDAAHTVVDQAVDAAGVLTQGKAGGLANAVLRAYLRRKDALWAAVQADAALASAHPKWWLLRLQKTWPDDWRRIVEADNGLPPLTLRINRRQVALGDYQARLQAAGIEAQTLPGLPDALRLPVGVPIRSLPGYDEGAFSVQDAGAQHAADWLDVMAGQRVLDACAAPGGKTAHLLERAEIELLALDIDAGRCRRIDENLNRLRLARPGVSVRPADAAQTAQWWDGKPFDRILLDAPCSGSGVVRRHPDAKWLRREADLPALRRVQEALLLALWRTLAPGGKLLYVTCSVFAEENTQQIAAFLKQQPDARLLREQQLLPDAGHDGFYHALLEKADA